MWAGVSSFSPFPEGRMGRSESGARRPRYTSQRCNACGHTCRENRASQSRFRCVACGHMDNADLNAARNILGRAVPSGINVAVVNASVA
ncbi:zinc ribbon domain-containing protein [Deinococcus malanensis]|uniref:zinc ribbon domain-containing protein n=1 Tax=Deinococcus malanensis TaxID=1706855 RepID=UPI0036450A6B